MKIRTLTTLAVPAALLLGALATPAEAIFKPIGTYETGIFDDSAAEIGAYDPLTQRLFVTNGANNTIDILDINDPTNLFLNSSIDLSGFGGGVNSVAFSDGLLAAAVEAEDTQAPGSVAFFDVDGLFQDIVEVGALPDMLTFTPDGSKILVANEGEPSDDYSNDPEGSVSIIDLSNGLGNATVQTAGFTQFNNATLDDSVRIFGPGATVAQDLEPEYIAVAPDGKTAWVTLQENNAVGVLDIESGEFIDVLGLGFKDHSEEGNGLDASDRDDAINIDTYDNLFGMYQPDAIASYEVDGVTYYVTANEGDAREYEDEEAGFEFVEEERVSDLELDPTAFPNADELQADENLGRLTVTTTLGDTDGDGDFDELYAFGARSFTIWDEDGNLVFDSGDDFEQILQDLIDAGALPEVAFNANNDENGFDSRSDAKGPEPEAIEVGIVGDRVLAFVGLERVGGIMIYDITDPTAPTFIEFANNRDYEVDFDEETFQLAGDLGPEDVIFISREQSPIGKNMLVVTNEVSGTTTVYADIPEPGTVAGLLAVGSLGCFGLKRRKRQ